jgi:hypothetical protein
MKGTRVVVAFLDATVLYPAFLRDLLMRLAVFGVFRANWSARVQDEWTTALLRNRPDLSRRPVERTRQLMDAHFPEALVVGYEHRIESITLPDADDRHVAAAAIHCGATAIVTANLRHFPAATLAPYNVAAVHPDAFVLGLLENNRERTLLALRALRNSFANPRKSTADLLDAMRRHRLLESADAVFAFLDLL